MEKQIIDFAVWYSGMDRDKVERAYQRYLAESPCAGLPSGEGALQAEQLNRAAFAAGEALVQFDWDVAEFSYKNPQSPNYTDYDSWVATQ